MKKHSLKWIIPMKRLAASEPETRCLWAGNLARMGIESSLLVGSAELPRQLGEGAADSGYRMMMRKPVRKKSPQIPSPKPLAVGHSIRGYLREVTTTGGHDERG
jgi:hypothetical protein